MKLRIFISGLVGSVTLAASALVDVNSAFAAECYFRGAPVELPWRAYPYDYQHSDYLVTLLYQTIVNREPAPDSRARQIFRDQVEYIYRNRHSGLLDVAMSFGDSAEFSQLLRYCGVAGSVRVILDQMGIPELYDSQGYRWENMMMNRRAGHAIREMVATREFSRLHLQLR